MCVKQEFKEEIDHCFHIRDVAKEHTTLDEEDWKQIYKSIVEIAKILRLDLPEEDYHEYMKSILKPYVNDDEFARLILEEVG